MRGRKRCPFPGIRTAARRAEPLGPLSERSTFLVADPGDQRAAVVPAEERGKSLGHLFKAVADVLAVSQLASSKPLRQLRGRFVIAVGIVRHEEPLQPDRAVNDPHHVQRLITSSTIISRDLPAQCYPTTTIEPRHHIAQQGAANIVEEHVDAPGAQLVQTPVTFSDL